MQGVAAWEAVGLAHVLGLDALDDAGDSTAMALAYPGLTATLDAAADEATLTLLGLEPGGKPLDITRPEGTMAPVEF